jgi:hypothetical protein
MLGAVLGGVRIDGHAANGIFDGVRRRGRGIIVMSAASSMMFVVACSA